jgi:RNA polymerase sigma-70 factor (ECF subfamily)
MMKAAGSGRDCLAVEDKQAFGAIIRQNADMLRAFFLALTSDTQLADTMFHETFMTAWRKFDTYDPERQFGSWVRQIATRVAMDMKRKTGGRGMMYFDQESLALLEIQFAKGAKPGVDRWGDRLGATKQCVEALPKTAVDAVSLYYDKNYNPREIAIRLGLDLATTKKRLQNSRKLLYDCINAKLGGSS